MPTGRKQHAWMWVGILVVALLLHPAAGWSETAQPTDAAKVNGSSISMPAYEREMARLKHQMENMGRPIPQEHMAEAAKEVLENLINQELLYQQSVQDGVSVSESAVDEQLAMIKSQLQDDEGYKKYLIDMNMTEKEVREQLQRIIAIQRFIDQRFVQKVTITDTEIRAFYDEHKDTFHQPERVHARHILIAVKPEAEESVKKEAMEQIESIRDKLREGGDFAALAKEFSSCPSSEQGGDLGFFTKGRMVAPFEEAAFQLEPGQISEVVETPFGYHLIQVLERSPASTADYDEVKGSLEPFLKQQKVREQVQAHLEASKRRSDITRYLSAPEGE